MSEQQPSVPHDARNVTQAPRPEASGNLVPQQQPVSGMPAWPSNLPLPQFMVPQGMVIPQGMIPMPGLPMVPPEMARQAMASMMTAASLSGFPAPAVPSPTEPHASIRSSNVSPAPSGVSGAAGVESEAGGVGDRGAPPSKKRASVGSKTEKKFPKDLYPFLAQTLKGTDSMSMDDIASKFVSSHPGPSVRCTVDSIKRIATKEKLPGETKQSWVIREEFLPLLKGEVMDVDAIAPPQPKAVKRPASSAAELAASAGAPASVPKPAKKVKTDGGESSSEPKPVFFEKYSVDTALKLCDVIIAILNGALRHDDSAFLDKKPPFKIDWARVCETVKESTALQTPLECQRLWKYMAYGRDIGELAVLAPDSDDEDIVPKGRS